MGIKILHFLPLLTCMVLFLSCSNGEYDFENGDDAIKAYTNFLHEAKGIKTSNTKDFIEQLCKWQEINDTVWHYLNTQPEYMKAHDHAGTVMDIHDSVRYQMLRISETWKYSYDDVLRIKEATSPFLGDKDLQKAVTEATPFFEAMDSTAVMDVDKSTLLTRYKLFLIMTKDKTFQSKEDMKAFIRQEDLFFRSFLYQLHNMENISLSEITRNTEIICSNIIVAAREGRIPAKDVMVYMSIRTDRRLLQNSMVCINDINNQDMTGSSLANAYLWMIIQPFISIDQFSMATLTTKERKAFEYIASSIPKSSSFARTFHVEQRSLNYLLPQQLLKIYIYKL